METYHPPPEDELFTPGMLPGTPGSKLLISEPTFNSVSGSLPKEVAHDPQRRQTQIQMMFR